MSRRSPPSAAHMLLISAIVIYLLSGKTLYGHSFPNVNCSLCMNISAYSQGLLGTFFKVQSFTFRQPFMKIRYYQLHVNVICKEWGVGLAGAEGGTAISTSVFPTLPPQPQTCTPRHSSSSSTVTSPTRRRRRGRRGTTRWRHSRDRLSPAKTSSVASETSARLEDSRSSRRTWWTNSTRWQCPSTV